MCWASSITSTTVLFFLIYGLLSSTRFCCAVVPTFCSPLLLLRLWPCWWQKQEKISFRKVTLIKSAKTLGLVSSAIDISTATENVHVLLLLQLQLLLLLR